MRLMLAAATDWRSLIWLGAGVAVAAALSNPFPALGGLALYIWMVQRLVASPTFQAAGEQARTAQGLAAHYRKLQAVVAEVNARLSKPGVALPERDAFTRARAVITAAREIYQEWLLHPLEHAARTQAVDQAIQIAYLYLRMLRSYQAVYSAEGPVDPNEVRVRLERARRKLAEVTDAEARRDLARAVELDERVLGEVGSVEAERERFQAKLAAIEATMDLLRRQIFSPDEAEETERLQNILLEAEAMDSALDEVRRRTRSRA